MVEGFFGLRPEVDGSLTESSQLQSVDRSAVLRGVRVGGRLVDVTIAGAVDAQPAHSSGEG